MKYAKAFCRFAFLFVFVSPLSAAPVAMQQGLWETRLQVKMEGVALALPPMTNRHCIDSAQRLPALSQPAEQCQISEHKDDGQKIYWRVRCVSNEGEMDGQGSIQYQSDRYQGELVLKLSTQKGAQEQFNYRLAGERVGPCLE